MTPYLIIVFALGAGLGYLVGYYDGIQKGTFREAGRWRERQVRR